MGKPRMSKGKSIIALVLVVVMMGALAFTAAFGIQIGDILFPKVFDDKYGVRKGLDLVGGSSITYEAQVEGEIDAAELSADMDTVVGMLNERLSNQGYTEATVAKSGDKRVIIEIPSVSDPEEAVQQIGSTAKVEFLNGDGDVIMDGTAIANAKGVYGKQSDADASAQWYIAVELQDDGAKIFEDTTRTYLGQEGKNHIAITMDGKTLLDANFDKVIAGKNISITGSYTEETAKRTGDLIAAGSLPFELKDIELRSVGPTLGERSLETCLFAGAIGVLIVMLFMIIMYRLPGFLTSVILVGYIAVVGLIISIFRVNLSLPGIAGIILSIGMAVDANVIIFERIKEELQVGKSLKGSITAGFSRALSAILDANVTTIIASAVLYQFGTGPVKGFAITLFIGIVVSMFAAIVVTRFMMNMMANLNIKNPKLYYKAKKAEKAIEVVEDIKEPFNFIDKRKIFAIISTVVILCGVVSMVVQGFNLGIDFVGGTTMQVNFKQEVTQELQTKIGDVVAEVIGEQPSSVQKTGEGSEGIIKTKELSTDERDTVFEALKTEFSLEDGDKLSTENVTATVGKDLQRSAFLASFIAVVLMLIYIGVRFEFVTAASAVSCLIHDVLVVLAFASIFQMPMNTTFIAAILTILGYSINATIVVFDRVRENKTLMKRLDFDHIVDTSIWQTMGRSINTSFTTLVVIVVLYFLGVPAIKEFAMPIIIGICAGTYSSVCLAGNAWCFISQKIGKTK